MPQLEASALVPLSPADAFALAHTLGDDRRAWDADVVERMLLREHRDVGPGALVFERVHNGRRAILRYDVWFPGEVSATSLVKGPFWLAEYGEGWHVAPATLPDGAPGSRVVAKLVWQHALPVLREGAGSTLTAAFRAELERRMAGFEDAARDAALLERVRSGRLPRGARHRDRRRD